MTLKDINKHERDSRIVFDEEPHIYYIDGSCKDYISATTIIHSFFGKFNADEIIAKCKKNPKSKYFKMTVDEIKRFISSSEKFNFIYGEFDYYMSVSDFVVSLVKSNELEYSKEIIDKIEDLLIRRVSAFSNLDEEEQIFYIEGITSDIIKN